MTDDARAEADETVETADGMDSPGRARRDFPPERLGDGRRGGATGDILAGDADEATSDYNDIIVKERS